MLVYKVILQNQYRFPHSRLTLSLLQMILITISYLSAGRVASSRSIFHEIPLMKAIHITQLLFVKRTQKIRSSFPDNLHLHTNQMAARIRLKKYKKLKPAKLRWFETTYCLKDIKTLLVKSIFFCSLPELSNAFISIHLYWRICPLN